MIDIKICPNCGSASIHSVRRDLKGSARGISYTVRGLRFHECPDCGERVYGPEAMRRIEARSPAFAKGARRTA